MIKMLYLGALFIMIVMVLVAVGLIYKRKDTVSRSIVALFVVILFAIIVNSVFCMSDVEAVGIIAHSMFLASIDWVLLFMLRFVMRYTDYNRGYGKMILPFYVVAVAETIIMALNPILHHVFTLEARVNESFGTYFTPTNYTFYFYIHLAFSYILVIWIYVLLITKVMRTAKVYRTKYTSLIGCLSLVIVFDAIGLAMHPPIDISLLFYCIGCLAICFFSMFFVPKKMRDTILSTAVQVADMGVACFDFSGKCIYLNNRGRQMIRYFNKFQIGEDYQGLEEYFAGWLTRHWEEGDEEKVYLQKIKSEYRTYSYEFTIQRLSDEEEAFLGYFINCIDRTEEYERYDEEHYKATHDMLTGIYNEQYFEQKVVETLHKFPEVPYVMITSDIKDFKLVNDLFGTERGDEILKMHAVKFREYAGEHVVYGRLVEDRFGFCMPKERFETHAFVNVMDQIQQRFTNDFFKLQIKMGVYEIQDINEPIFVMIDKCNLAISKIKDVFSCNVATYDEGLFQEEMEKYGIINEFDAALAKGDFELHLQAQTTEDGKVLGAEALARWRYRDGEMMSPAKFVPVLEHAGLIYRLDAYMWEQAAMQLAKWKKMGREDLHISVNISAKDQYHIDIFDTFKKLVEEYDISPKNLKLEITESIFITEIDKHLELVKQLQAYGFDIEIDDFGSGYSSLNILKDISANVLKIDMGFIRETPSRRRSQEIVSSVVDLAKKLDMFVIVEGVETKEQLDALRAMKCDAYQGYYFAKPIPVEEFEAKYMA